MVSDALLKRIARSNEPLADSFADHISILNEDTEMKLKDAVDEIDNV